MAYAFVAGTLGTKGTELRYVADLVAATGEGVRTVDLSTQGAPAGADVTADRGSVVAGVATAFARYGTTRGDLGGSGGTALVTPAMRTLPVGTPKIMVSTVAARDVSAYVGAADIGMLHSVTDVAGLNRISRAVLGNAAYALAGTVAHEVPAATARSAVALSMFGVTTTCVNAVTERLGDTADPLVFHATGTGGRAMKSSSTTGWSARFATSPPPRSPTCSTAGCSAPASTGSAPQPARRCPTSAPSARWTWSTSPRRTPYPNGCRPAVLPAQPAGHPDAHHTRGMPRDRRVHRRQAERLPGPVRFLLPTGGDRLPTERAMTEQTRTFEQIRR